jgi:hypothetical protein
MKDLGASLEASLLDRRFILLTGVHILIRGLVYNFFSSDELNRGKLEPVVR